MGQFLETRVSLILRLAQPQDVEAWEEFTAVYVPALYRLATSKGLGQADAEDVTQEILFAVARAVERWKPDADRARFRTWLCSIARNLIADFFKQGGVRWQTVQLSDSALDQLASSCVYEPIVDQFDSEYHKAVFQLAASRVRSRVTEKSWIAFTSTAIDQAPAESVAIRLGMRPGSVYVVRCRVLKLLREEAQRIDSGLSGEFPKLDQTSSKEIPR